VAVRSRGSASSIRALASAMMGVTLGQSPAPRTTTLAAAEASRSTLVSQVVSAIASPRFRPAGEADGDGFPPPHATAAAAASTRLHRVMPSPPAPS
jgi:hypothetical protein